MAGAVAGYTAAVYILGERIFIRLSPWTSTALLLLPVAVVIGLALVIRMPAGLVAGAFGYVGISLLVIAAIGYGGCEIVGIPALVLRRRYVMYCALNTIDAAERQIARDRGPARTIAGLLALAAGIYYFLVQNILSIVVVHLPFNDRWITLLILPAIAVMARDALTGVRTPGHRRTARQPAIAAAALAATAAGIAISGGLSVVYAALSVFILAGGIAAATRPGAGSRRAPPVTARRGRA
jgi:hypothetical protein